jgi:uncharacterized protein YegP (UPF0339 family)
MKYLRESLVLLALLAVFGLLGLHFAAAQDKKDKDKAKDKDGKAAATAVFELYKDRGGKFRFRFKDEEGNEVAMSAKGYDTKAEVQKVIAAIQKGAAKAKIEDDAK